MYAPGDVRRALRIGAEHAAAEAVGRAVGDAHRIRVVPIGDDGEHRTEDLLLRDRRLVVDVGEHGGLDEPTPVELRGPPAAGDEAAFALAGRDEAFDAVAMRGRR